MTYCVGMLVDTGLVMLSDSRTNAGVDQINTFRKMVTFQRAGDRILVLMSAGNLAITQAVVHALHEHPGRSARHDAVAARGEDEHRQPDGVETRARVDRQDLVQAPPDDRGAHAGARARSRGWCAPRVAGPP